MSEETKRLYRSRDERMIAGVCGGLGKYFDIDPTLIRIAFVFGVFLTGSGLFWAYLVLMLVVPEESLATVTTTREEPLIEETEEE